MLVSEPVCEPQHPDLSMVFEVYKRKLVIAETVPKNGFLMNCVPKKESQELMVVMERKKK